MSDILLRVLIWSVAMSIVVWAGNQIYGAHGRAWRKAGCNTVRVMVVFRALGFTFGGGFLWGVTIIASRLIERPIPESLGVVGIGAALLVMVASGAWLIIGTMFMSIQYDGDVICATMDQSFNRRHCHRWADLTSVEEILHKPILHFSDGGHVVLGGELTGRRVLHNYALAVLDSRKDDEAH